MSSSKHIDPGGKPDNGTIAALEHVGGAMSDTLREQAEQQEAASLRIASAEAITTYPGLNGDTESRNAKAWIARRLGRSASP